MHHQVWPLLTSSRERSTERYTLTIDQPVAWRGACDERRCREGPPPPLTKADARATARLTVSTSWAFLRPPPQEEVSQHNGVVMDLVVSGEHERNRTLSCLGT